MPQILKGSTDVTRYVMLRDSTAGTPEVGYTITSLDLQYTRNRAEPAAKVDATALSDQDDAHADNQAIEIDGTSSPGLYRVDWPDAAFATGADKVILVVSGTGLDPAVEEIELVDFSLQGQSAIDLKDFADDGYDPSTNKVQGVVLTDTVTTYTGNTPQTGDSFARIGVAGAGLTNIDLPNQTMDITGNITGNVSGSVGSVSGAVGSVTGNVGGNVTGSVGSVVGAVGSVTGAVGSVTGNVGGNVAGSVGSVTGAINTAAGVIQTLDALDTAQDTQHSTTQTAVADVPTNAELATALGTADDAILAAIAALNNLSSAGAQSAVTAALTAALTEGYRTAGATASVRDMLYEIIAHLGDSGIAGTTKTIRNLAGTAAKTFTLDSATVPTSITEAT